MEICSPLHTLAAELLQEERPIHTGLGVRWAP